MAQLKDLLVTGASRFLNDIYGNLKGNASSADKVNHTFTVCDVVFDGSGDEKVTKADISAALELDDSLKLIGVVDTRFTVLRDGETNSVVDATTNEHIIFLSEKIATQRKVSTGTATYNDATVSVSYFTPAVGDIVLQNEMEYICTGITTNSSKVVTASKWVALDTSGYWYTW